MQRVKKAYILRQIRLSYVRRGELRRTCGQVAPHPVSVVKSFGRTEQRTISNRIWAGGGTGIRTRLRTWREQSLVGSSPTLPTNEKIGGRAGFLFFGLNLPRIAIQAPNRRYFDLSDCLTSRWHTQFFGNKSTKSQHTNFLFLQRIYRVASLGSIGIGGGIFGGGSGGGSSCRSTVGPGFPTGGIAFVFPPIHPWPLRINMLPRMSIAKRFIRSSLSRVEKHENPEIFLYRILG